MNIRCVTVDRLTSDEIDAWRDIQRDVPLLLSPYFRPEFTQAVAAVRSDVEVAVLEDGGRPIGFFPFQRTPWNSGRPIGGRLSDFHALVARPEVECEPIELIRACGLSSWHFDHLVGVHPSFERCAWSSAESPYIDVSEGFEAYLLQRGSKRHVMKEFGQKKRKLEREVGPVRFEQHVNDPAIVSTMIDWKTQQYLRTKVDNIFAFRWVVELMEKITEFDETDAIAPLMSVTYVGDDVAAINFGMRSGPVLHPWFPVYNVELQRYSPGTMHWIHMLQAAESMGIKRLDLAKGGESYKQRFKSGSIQVFEGTIDRRSSVAVARRAWRRTHEFVRSSPVYAHVRGPVRMMHNVKAWLELR